MNGDSIEWIDNVHQGPRMTGSLFCFVLPLPLARARISDFATLYHTGSVGAAAKV